MKVIVTVICAGALIFLHSSCTKEHSREAPSITVTSTLPPDYSFSTGYCSGGVTSLGTVIVDTVNFTPMDSTILPHSFLLDMPVPDDQGRQNSCAAWATVYAAGSYFIHEKTGKPFSDTGNLSPGFVYNQISKGHCSCSSILDNLYLLKTSGACSLGKMPFKDTDCTSQPGNSQRNSARKHLIDGWQKINPKQLVLIKRALVEKHPVIFATGIDAAFKKLQDPYIWRSSLAGSAGVHAMVITGYDDTKNAFRIMNSWSTRWADKGFAWIDYQTFVNNVIDYGYIIV